MTTGRHFAVRLSQPDEALPSTAANSLRMFAAGSVNAAQDDAELLAGLLAPNACIDSKFLYDAQGSALFDAIRQLDEYYPVQAEARLFALHRKEIAALLPRGVQWVDLGCGDGAKSRGWLGAVAAERYIGVDLAAECLQPAVARIACEFRELEAIGVVADLAQPLSLRPLLDERADCAPVFFYPGSSIGNFEPAAALDLLRGLRRHCSDQGQVLIGVDGAREKAQLEAAYDDALGLTAAFNRNLLRVVNHRLGADFAPQAFAHLAFYSVAHSRIEMRLAARHALTVNFARPEPASRRFDAGETLLTEHAYKYPAERFCGLLRQAGFTQTRAWTDAATGYGLLLGAP